MWLHEIHLRSLGFRRGSTAYWSCCRRFGLRGEEHLSIFARSELESDAHRGTRSGRIVEFSEFHVTLPLSENVHFYYHESGDRSWSAGGHTSSAEIRRLGLDPSRLRERADRVAGLFANSLGGSCRRESG